MVTVPSLRQFSRKTSGNLNNLRTLRQLSSNFVMSWFESFYIRQVKRVGPLK